MELCLPTVLEEQRTASRAKTYDECATNLLAENVGVRYVVFQAMMIATDPFPD